MSKAEEYEIHPIVQELIDLRVAAKTGQQEIADELGYESGSTVSGIERGKQSPRLDVVDAWASLFDRRVALVPTNQTKAAPTKTSTQQPDTVTIQLTSYQVALITSELVNRADGLHNSGRSSRMVKDLDAIVAILDKAVGR